MQDNPSEYVEVRIGTPSDRLAVVYSLVSRGKRTAMLVPDYSEALDRGIPVKRIRAYS